MGLIGFQGHSGEGQLWSSGDQGEAGQALVGAAVPWARGGRSRPRGRLASLTSGHPGADGNALLVLQDGEHTDEVLHAGLELPDGGGHLVPRHAELHFQAVLVGGRVHNEVLRDPHLILPGQVYSLLRHFCHSEVFGRGYWGE